MTPEKCIKCGRRAPLYTFAGNLALSAIKVIGGILSNSVGLTIDGFHSLADAVASIFVFTSMRIAEIPRDKSHPYGHGKAEFMASLLIYTMLLVVGIVFLVESARALIMGSIKRPHPLGALVAMVSVLGNYVMLSLNNCAGKKLNSPALIANGHENFTDLCSSIPVVIAIIAAQFGVAFADPLAGVFVSVLIIGSAGTMWMQSLHNLVDRGVSAATLKKIRNIATAVEGVIETKYVRTRRMGKNLWIDLGVTVGADLCVEEANEIADEVRGRLLRKGKHMEDVMVYYFNAAKPRESATAPG